MYNLYVTVNTLTMKGCVTMPLLQQNKEYTIDDIYALPDGQRAELIDGQMYMMAPPTRRHQRITLELSTIINNYIKDKGDSCEVDIAPFAVFLNADDKKLCRAGYKRYMQSRQAHRQRLHRRAGLDH